MSETLGESPVVAFNLGMTLVDVRQAVQESLEFTASRMGADFDTSNVDSHLGRPIEAVLSKISPDNPEEAQQVCRRHMGEVGVRAVELLPGADRAVETVRRFGGHCVVLTAMEKGLATRILDRVGLGERIDEVRGGLWSEQKAQALGGIQASVYVGEHPGDMHAAREARVKAIGVVTGTYTREALQTAGAEIVIDSLMDFPREFESLLRAK